MNNYKHEIVTDTHILSEKSKECFFTDMDILKNELIVKEMSEAILERKTCVGLAAIQIGVPKRIILVNDLDNPGKLLIMVNPVIYCKKGGVKSDIETCLSFPGKRFKIRRHKAIKVKWNGLKGIECKMVFKGFQARIIQHEIDHIEGKLR